MKKAVIVLILLLLLGCIIYTGWKIFRILPFPLWMRWTVVGMYSLSAVSIFLLFAFERHLPMGLGTFLYELGTSWMIFLVYALLLFLLLDGLRLAHIVPDTFLRHSLTGSMTVFSVLAVLLTYGYLHYHHKYREVIEIQTEKPLARDLTIVLASDLHLGYSNRSAELSRWVEMINAEKPDLVLLGGDILDGFIRPARGMESCFQAIDAPVYCCLGNHEYMTGIRESISFLEDAGITLLRDSSVSVNGICIIGRDDRYNHSRQPLSRLNPPDSLFTIVLDHQPMQLEEAEKAGIDFQFSGHTHNGQIWPGNWIASALFEKAYGRHHRGATGYYISSGLGIWGGKFRIGTRSEYIVMHLKHY